MAERAQDPGLENLLDLDSQVLVVDPAGKHWVKFVVKRVPPSRERPHGLVYALTLHGADGVRLLGFDNAHPVGGRRTKVARGPAHDHRHRLGAVRRYEYSDAATLLLDFWAEVEAVLKERGVLS